MLEQKHQPLAPLSRFVARIFVGFGLGTLFFLCSLLMGTLGLHHFENLNWPNAFDNAALILSDMGPITQPTTTEGSIFVGCYAVFSGILYISVVGIFFVPIIHRLLHKFHIGPEEEDKIDK
jgi:hypothetical protein